MLKIELTFARHCEKPGRIYEADSDKLMAARIAGGDKAAWGWFFDHYSPWAYRYAYWSLNQNKADAEDLCSDIMLSAAKSIGTFDSRRGDLDAWVHGLARKRLAHFCRSRKIELPITECDSIPAPSAVPFESKEAVNLALASIPQRQAAALIAKYVDGCTTDEVADIMGSTPKAAESLLTRARAAFRTAFNTLTACAGCENNE